MRLVVLLFNSLTLGEVQVYHCLLLHIGLVLDATVAIVVAACVLLRRQLGRVSLTAHVICLDFPSRMQVKPHTFHV